MNTLVRWDLLKTRWTPLKDREDLESRLATMLGTREATGHGGKEALTVPSGRRWWTLRRMRRNTSSKSSCRT